MSIYQLFLYRTYSRFKKLHNQSVQLRFLLILYCQEICFSFYTKTCAAHVEICCSRTIRFNRGLSKEGKKENLIFKTMNCLIYMNPNFTLSCKLILDPSYLILSSLKKGELNLDMETCFFCGISASNEVTLEKCQHCNLVSYCCQRHEKLHRPKNICYPVRIERHPTKGKSGFRHE